MDASVVVIPSKEPKSGVLIHLTTHQNKINISSSKNLVLS